MPEIISATETARRELIEQDRKDDAILQPYYRAYLKAHGYTDKPDHEYGSLEFILWINQQQANFRKMRNWPRHKPFNRQMMIEFSLYIGVPEDDDLLI